jgi:hypothetical protein
VLALLALGALIFFVSRRLHNGPGRVVAQAAAGTPPADREAQTKSAELLAGYAARPPGGTPPLSYPPPKRRPLPRDRIEENHIFEGPPMLNLFVEDQNTAIGRRNIHVVKAGNIFTLGGGKSDFLIFLVPVPPHIAELHFDGHQCTLIPRKSQYFPDIGSQQVPNCIGKTVRVISDKNYELHIRIERYQDPLLALNKLLNSISVPG